MGYNLQNTQCLQGDGDCQVYVWVNDVHFHKDAGYNFPDDEGYMTITIAFSKSIRNMALFNNIGTFNLFSCYLKDETFCPFEVNK